MKPRNAKYKIRTFDVELRCGHGTCNTLLRPNSEASTWGRDQLTQKRATKIECPGCQKVTTVPAAILKLLS